MSDYIGQAHDFEIELGLSPAESTIRIDGKDETHCRRIRVEQDMEGPPIVTMELYARKVTIRGRARDVLEVLADDDGDEEVVHPASAGPGAVRHARRHVPYCSVCTPSWNETKP